MSGKRLAQTRVCRPVATALTMTSVPTISRGGSTSVLTISETKLAVRPTMQIMARSERPRTSMKVLARGAAPYSGTGIAGGYEVACGGRG